MQQITVGGYATTSNIPNGADGYNCLVGNTNWQANELNACEVISTPGIIDRFFIELSVAPGVGTQWQFWIRVNGATPAGTPTITISGLNTAGSDLVNSVAVAAGDYVDILATPTGVPVANSIARWSTRFTGSVAQRSLMLGMAIDVLNVAATEYNGLMDGNSNWRNADSFSYQVIPTPGTIRDFYVRLSLAPGFAGSSYRFTLRVNGASPVGGPVVTITHPATTNSDLANSVVVAAGDRVGIMCEALAGPTATPTAHWGLTFVPSIDGESVLLGGTSNDFDTALTKYLPIVSHGLNWANGNITQNQLAQVAVFRKLHIFLENAPGAALSGKQVTFTVWQNIAATLLSAVVFEVATTGSDLVNQIAILDSAEVEIEVVPLNAPTVGNSHWGLVCYIAPGARKPSGNMASKLMADRFI